MKKIKLRIEDIITGIHNLEDVCYPDYEFKINYLTIFAQSVDDYRNLREVLQKLGKELEANNGYKYELTKPIEFEDESIDLIRIRKPDVHRPELGCADLSYNDADYEDLRCLALDNGFDVILRSGYEMIELSNFSINVYSYLVRDLD